MKCPQCKAENPDGKNFCSDCAAVLEPQLIPIVRAQVEAYIKENFSKDQTVFATKTTEEIAERFLKWGKWFFVPATGLMILLGLIFGLLGYNDARDVHKAAEQAITESKAATDKATEADTKSKAAVHAIETSEADFQRTADTVKGQYKQLQGEGDKYKQVTDRLDVLQKELSDAQGNWKTVDLTVRSLRTAPARPGEPNFIGLSRPICPTPAAFSEGIEFAVCFKGSSLFQVTRDGTTKPVSSVSPEGFQDVSTNSRPSCAAANRGTFYVEKGAGHVADKPYLCARESDGTFAWISLAPVP
jgi:hypothetical protein